MPPPPSSSSLRRLPLLPAIDAALRQRAPRRIEHRVGGAVVRRRTSVAAVWRDSGGGSAELLLLRRKPHAGSPFSGQVCFPGGHREPADADDLAAC
eukprot:gene10773-8287_t